MNLLIAPWLPFRRRDGSQEYLPVTAMVDPEIIDLALPREDFQGAAYQFLIGLLQTAMAPEDKEEWVRLYQTPPSIDELREVLEKWQPAFELDSDGPAFMQDFDLLAEEKNTDIAALLIDSPGAATVKNNTDHFVKAGRVERLCPDCAALALFTLQINAPSGGKGYRTGLRGGGPLTTLIMPVDTGCTLWQRLWLNVLDTDGWNYDAPSNSDPRVFPWLGQTKVSDKGQGTFPEEMHPLHPYWAMPRRIRLNIRSSACRCDLCGRNSEKTVSSLRARNYGFNYDGPWIHPLTPYRRDPKKPEQLPYSRKAQADGLGYRYWEALTIKDEEEKGFLPAWVVLDYAKKCDTAEEMDVDLPTVASLWVFGYDMDNMKPRCWYGAHMPLLALSDEARALAHMWLRQMIDLTDSSARLLQNQVKEAWFSRPKDAKGDMSYIGASLWETTEQVFYQLLMELGELLTGGTPPQRFPAEIAAHWYRTVTRQATTQFDAFALSGPAEQLDMKRITKARNTFQKQLHRGKEAKAFRKTGRLDDSGQPQSAGEKQGETA
ncbi:type I-E CRISPR-associated protein Cse1/CasA [Microbulbifer thermotolerans]|uniref:type I-E CRISPR-associated protein Cse1/CasA n=1 Tax=Microbulbifer thermotolerans TaxID=252514 RepID=UPI002673F5FC|nr:type I-E CRISPR-associated protein Cse1/CasA [Microbulbifer thermotolerans]WKT61205.1 type I-E CRISPR-associated protein Cse1/CasA [Microbulbifer thermotolerans]